MRSFLRKKFESEKISDSTVDSITNELDLLVARGNDNVYLPAGMVTSPRMPSPVTPMPDKKTLGVPVLDLNFYSESEASSDTPSCLERLSCKKGMSKFSDDVIDKIVEDYPSRWLK